MKGGDVSILRLDFDGKGYRAFVQRARGVPMEKELKGTYLKARFDRPVKDILHTIIYNGIAHHASMVYGDYIKPIEIFGRISGIPVLR
jgi:L-fucose isomerase-like protein